MDFVKLFGPFGMFFVMFSIALSLKAEDFKKLIKKPKPLYVGIGTQGVLVPLIGVCFVTIAYDLPAQLKTSIILLTILPTAVMSNYIAKKAQADVALSISMTAIGCSFAFIKLPLFFYFISAILIPEGQIVFPKIDLFETSAKLLMIVTIPVLLGLAFNDKFPKLAKKLDVPFDRISMFLFLIIVFGGIFQERHALLGYFKLSGVISVIILTAIFFTSIAVTEAFKLKQVERRAILIECILQNGAIGFVIGALMFDDINYLIPIATYAIIQYLFLIVYFLIRRS